MSLNSNANFSPVLDGYTGQGSFKFWCQKVLPLVYDDSLSYYELLNKVVTYLNNTISDVSTVEDNVDALLNAYNQLQEYVNNYFSGLDIQQEINNKLDEMASSGALNVLINPVVISATDAWLNNNITPTSPALDETLTLSNAAAQSKVVGDALYYAPQREHTDSVTRVQLYVNDRERDEGNNLVPKMAFDIVENLEIDSYSFVEGFQLNREKLNEYEFPFTVSDNTTYYVSKTRRRRGSGFMCFDIASITGRRHYRGVRTESTSGGVTSVSWSWYDLSVASVVDDAANALTVAETALTAATKTLKSGDIYVYGDVATEEGWWTTNGNIGANTYPRTELLEVLPNERIYITNVPNNSTLGYWFDANKEIKTRILKSNGVAYDYLKPNAFNQNATNYVPLYYLDVPSDVYYVSLNLNAGRTENWSLSNKPIYGGCEYGNLIVRKGDKNLALHGNKKLCVIGPSTVMIDRRYPDGGGVKDCIIGWQEYLMPFYSQIDSYGYSGCGWGDAFTYDSIYPSIHHMITSTVSQTISGRVIEPVDLSVYDDFILCSSHNGWETTPTGGGEWIPAIVSNSGYLSDPYNYSLTQEQKDTYLGGIMDTVLHIYKANPKARIYVCGFNCAGMYTKENGVYVVDTADQTWREEINLNLENMCKAWGLHYIPCVYNGFNQITRGTNRMNGGGDSTYVRWHYDKSHPNNYGSKMVAEFYMKHLL